MLEADAGRLPHTLHPANHVVCKHQTLHPYQPHCWVAHAEVGRSCLTALQHASASHSMPMFLMSPHAMHTAWEALPPSVAHDKAGRRCMPHNLACICIPYAYPFQIHENNTLSSNNMLWRDVGSLVSFRLLRLQQGPVPCRTALQHALAYRTQFVRSD